MTGGPGKVFAAGVRKATPWLGTARQVLRAIFESCLGEQRKEL